MRSLADRALFRHQLLPPGFDPGVKGVEVDVPNHLLALRGRHAAVVPHAHEARPGPFLAADLLRHAHLVNVTANVALKGVDVGVDAHVDAVEDLTTLVPLAPQ